MNGMISMSAVYGIAAVMSLLLAFFCWKLLKRKEKWLILVHASVFVVNTGYFILSVSETLQQALMANRLAYFGSVFLPLFMFMSIMDVCHIRYCRGIFAGLLLISTAVFLLAASGGYLDLYYKAVSLEHINGAAKLIKEYGPLHVLYLVYLLLYFAAMAGVILYSVLKKNVTSHKLAVYLAGAVFGNIGIWLVEQLFSSDFEFLSVSYLITELLLILVYSIIQEGQAEMNHEESEEVKINLPQNMEELFSSFAERMETLSAAEKRIFSRYLEGYDAAGITEKEFVSLSTVRKHSGNIYRKLQISSRDELMLYIDLFRRCDRLEQLVMKLDEKQDEVKSQQ